MNSSSRVHIHLFDFLNDKMNPWIMTIFTRRRRASFGVSFQSNKDGYNPCMRVFEVCVIFRFHVYKKTFCSQFDAFDDTLFVFYFVTSDDNKGN